MTLEAYFRAWRSTGAARGATHGRHRDLPGQRLLPGRFDPDMIEPGDLRGAAAQIEAAVGDAHGFDAEDAIIEIPVSTTTRGPRDADALPRPPPGPGRHRHRVRGADQRLRRRRGLHRRAFRLAVVRVDGGLRGRAAVPLPDGAAGAADRGAEVPAAAHRHAGADGRLRRLLRLHLLGAGRRRLPDVRHHAGADLRPEQASRTSRLRCFFRPGDIVKFRRSTARSTTRCRPRSRRAVAASGGR